MQNKTQNILFAVTMAVLLAFLLSLPVFAATTEQVLYSFNASGQDGAVPLAGLIFDKSGNLYGTTAFGGASGAGSVFQLVPGTDGTWTENVLHSFGQGNDAQVPYGGLIFDSSGNLYGTATGGGTFGDGAVFELIAGKNGTWTEQVLHSFGQGQDGQSPEGGLVFDTNGNLYGTTLEGGGYDDGTVFELTPGANGAWTETVVHTFTPNGKDGVFPEAGLILVQGYLLGTTYEGGTANVGTVFALARNKIGWAETVLHSFEHNGIDGYAPEAVLTLDGTGTLIGTTTEGGTANDGTVFGLTQNKYGTWVEKVLYSFNHNNAGGSIPFSGVVLDKSGNLYGTAYVGGQYSFGTVFELTPGTNGTWTENVLHAFDPNGQDGLQSEAGVIFDTKGNLYGTTTVGGTGGNGAVFEVLP